jgi:hypothetical protein
MDGTSRAAQVARTIARAVQLDLEWQGKVAEDDRRYTPWMPFQMFRFIALAAEAVRQLAEDGLPRGDIRALEIGCGPGPKMLVLRDLFGLDASGFDRNAEYVAAARSLGLAAETADAAEYTGYGRAHVIWFNRVARDPEIQARIERRVWAQARPGAIIICANLEGRPPPDRWLTVLDAWDDQRVGIWQKAGLPPGGN